MNVSKMIEELRKIGFVVEAHKRTDGGWLIKKINDMTFTGSSGNAYARELLGVELSQARIEQTKYNVEKYIKDTKKPKDQIDEALIKALKKVQRKWRKKKVKARVTKKKLRWHLKQGGRREAEEYLQKMSRYGEGYAYLENVEYLAKYVEDVARGVQDKELQEASFKVADFIRSKAELFKEEWISKVYSYWYEVITNKYSGLVVSKAIMATYSTIG